MASQVALVVKNPPANARDIRGASSIPGSGRSPGEGHGNPLQYACLENPTDRQTWRAMVHRVTKPSDIPDAMMDMQRLQKASRFQNSFTKELSANTNKK